jgi:hypothetical protein
MRPLTYVLVVGDNGISQVVPRSFYPQSNSRSGSELADIADVRDRSRASSGIGTHTSGGTQALVRTLTSNRNQQLRTRV